MLIVEPDLNFSLITFENYFIVSGGCYFRSDADPYSGFASGITTEGGVKYPILSHGSPVDSLSSLPTCATCDATQSFVRSSVGEN